MVREKIINFLKKIKDYDVDINIEIAPAVSLFGIINISFANGKIKLNPKKWNKEDEKRIAENLRREGVGISLEEFKECFEEDIKKVSKERVDSILNEIKKFKDDIKKALFENPLLSLEEFEKREEIKPLLKYKFIGRESELDKLHEFLESDEKVFFLTGEGGSGKTRLSIEFARRLKNSNWKVGFIHQDKEFKHSVVSYLLRSESILLILDEAARYSERGRVIGFVQNPDKNINIKLLLITRPVFMETIKNELGDRGISAQDYKITGGDIPSFLKVNFGIDEEKVKEIEEKCKGNFLLAIFIAEHYKETGKIEEPREVLHRRIERYKRDIYEHKHRNIPIDEIGDILFLFSLLTPIELKKDLNHLKEVLEYLPEYRFEHLRTIIGLANREGFFLFREGGEEKYAFKYDLVADYLLSEFIKKENFDRVMKKFLPYMPFNISYNLYKLRELVEIGFDGELVKKSIQILSEIWVRLNEIKGETPKYFSALVLFTGNFSRSPFFEIEKMDINHWLSCYKEISKTYPEKEVREKLAMGLANATFAYGRAGRLDKMESRLKELKELHQEYPERGKRRTC